MLCCAAGMSTSLLVNKMKKSAETLKVDVDIFATAVSGFDQELASRQDHKLVIWRMTLKQSYQNETFLWL